MDSSRNFIKQWFIRQRKNSILDCINDIEKAILPLIAPFQSEINLILTVPGVKDISAITILSEKS